MTRAIHSQSLFCKEQQEQIAHGRSLKWAILRKRAKSEFAKERIPNPGFNKICHFQLSCPNREIHYRSYGTWTSPGTEDFHNNVKFLEMFVNYPEKVLTEKWLIYTFRRHSSTMPPCLPPSPPPPQNITSNTRGRAQMCRYRLHTSDFIMRQLSIAFLQYSLYYSTYCIY